MKDKTPTPTDEVSDKVDEITDLREQIRLFSIHNQILFDQIMRWIDRYVGQRLSNGDIPASQVQELVLIEHKKLQDMLNQAVENSSDHPVAEK